MIDTRNDTQITLPLKSFWKGFADPFGMHALNRILS
jgi:hypothetical protein